MFRIGGHESGDSPAAAAVVGDDSMEVDHFFLVLVAAQDKQGWGRFSAHVLVLTSDFAGFDTVIFG